MIPSTQAEIDIPTWPYAYGGPQSTGILKSIVDDFIVDETLSFQPEGCGEHAFLLIEKCGENTEFIARLLARFSGVQQRDVGYAGLKDRHAKTRQWFSVWLPGKEDPDWKQVETENIKILKAIRHLRKLKRGVLSHNRFQIIIRQWQGSKTKLEQQLQQIKQNGFPNYFGLQRFGRQGQNVNKAIAMFNGTKVKREQRSIYLSAARSYLFNQVLAKRIIEDSWNQAVSGDCLIFDQSHSYFKAEKIDDSVTIRIRSAEIHATGMMFGKDQLETTNTAYEIEQSIINDHQLIADGLKSFNLSSDRRALRVMAINLQWEFLPNSTIRLNFSLPAGGYATSLLRELIKVT